ncbi:MAG: septal ring lytic transglycosylase RlpA family protein [Cyanobacteria bacterium J06648_16]
MQIKRTCVVATFMLSSLLMPPALADSPRVSWYGPGFHGNATASGETFDRWGHTAAHPSWPFGTLVELTHPTTGASVTVRINDRSGGTLDLAEQAAVDLGVRSQGTATVNVEVIRWGY